MTELLPQCGRGGRQAAANDNDGFLGCDSEAPSPAAQRRGHRVIILFLLLAGVVALVAGLSEGVQGVESALPSRPAQLLEAAMWSRLFESLGQLATVGLIAIAAALVLRWFWRRRRA